MTPRSRSLRWFPAVLVGAFLALSASPAAGALTATEVRIIDRAATVRVVVSFSGGPLAGLARQVDTLDPQIADRRAVVRVNATGITSTAGPRRGAGVRAVIARRPGNVVVLLTQHVGQRGRFKFVSYRASVPRNVLVIDLWKATTRAAATIRDDGCLRLTGQRSGPGLVAARGLELEPIFENNVVISLRAAGRGGATIALKPLIATGGVFLPDFSGFAKPGRWGGGLTHSVGTPARVMLEAWSTSAKDGSLDCLVQTPVVLQPPA